MMSNVSQTRLICLFDYTQIASSQPVFAFTLSLMSEFVPFFEGRDPVPSFTPETVLAICFLHSYVLGT